MTSMYDTLWAIAALHLATGFVSVVFVIKPEDIYDDFIGSLAAACLILLCGSCCVGSSRSMRVSS